MPRVRRRSKFNNTRCEYDGIKFASLKEMRRYKVLQILEEQGKIRELRTHPKPWYKMMVNGKLICSYEPDFTYYDEDGAFVVEDVKGKVTDVFKLKAKLMEALHGIKILIT